MLWHVGAGTPPAVKPYFSVIGDFNLTDVEIYKVLQELDEVPQYSYVLTCGPCQRGVLLSRWLESSVLYS